MTMKKKFYAVQVGRKPGVYQSWDECKKQVIGFPGALYKGFATEQEAKDYVAGFTAGKHPVKATNSDPIGLIGKHYDIYVDGSYFNQQYSWAFVVYNDDQLIHTESGLGEERDAAVIHNVAGELAAAVKAMEWADTQDVPCVVIHHDYIGISEWALGRWKTNNPFTSAYAKYAAKFLHKVRFNKVPGHAGVPGNELADKLAREALQKANS